ncbi:MAG: hypothetical protein FJX23_09655 [Alphaproteobacteria bacterium]|nr:hypothetical protein [Alphaproteobacteria bacterium]
MARKVPVKGTSAYTFNPVTGLYEHAPPSATTAEQEEASLDEDGKPIIDPSVKYRGSDATEEDVDPYARAGGYRGSEENSRGIRNVERDNRSRRANADAYREMMGEEPEEDTSVDDYETDRSYLRTSRRYNEGRYADSPRGIYSNQLGGRYSDEYDDEELYDTYGNRVSGYGRDGRSRRISNEPKTGNRDAYNEMMSQIEGGSSEDDQ